MDVAEKRRKASGCLAGQAGVSAEVHLSGQAFAKDVTSHLKSQATDVYSRFPSTVSVPMHSCVLSNAHGSQTVKRPGDEFRAWLRRLGDAVSMPDLRLQPQNRVL